VLDTFLFGDRVLLSTHPELSRAPVYCHFQSDVAALQRSELWGVLGDRASWRAVPDQLAERLKLLLFGFPEVPQPAGAHPAGAAPASSHDSAAEAPVSAGRSAAAATAAASLPPASPAPAAAAATSDTWPAASSALAAAVGAVQVDGAGSNGAGSSGGGGEEELDVVGRYRLPVGALRLIEAAAPGSATPLLQPAAASGGGTSSNGSGAGASSRSGEGQLMHVVGAAAPHRQGSA
jgi:hypothetical protein